MVMIPLPDGTSTILVLDINGDRSMTNTVAVSEEISNWEECEFGLLPLLILLA